MMPDVPDVPDVLLDALATLLATHPVASIADVMAEFDLTYTEALAALVALAKRQAQDPAAGDTPDDPAGDPAGDRLQGEE